MSNPYVREIGHVVDLDGCNLRVGVDYDSVQIGYAAPHKFARDGAFIAACWEAGRNAEHMAEEARDA
jgi:hypothetical protein